MAGSGKSLELECPAHHLHWSRRLGNLSRLGGSRHGNVQPRNGQVIFESAITPLFPSHIRDGGIPAPMRHHSKLSMPALHSRLIISPLHLDDLVARSVIKLS
jgi:hypothetical protein